MDVDASQPADGRGWRLAADLGLGLLVVILLVATNAGPISLGGPAVLAAGAVAVVTVMMRHRLLPVAATVAGVLVGFVPQGGVVLAVVAYTVGFREMGARRRSSLLAVLGLVPAIMTPIGIWILGITLAGYQLWAVAVVVVTCGALPALAGILVRQRRWLAAAERDAADNRRQAHLFAVSEARLRERSRIAVEMHDLLGHRLSLIALHGGGLELATLEGDPDAHRAAQLVRATARQALDELREVLGMLRTGEPGGEAHTLTDATGTRADIAALVAGSRAAGVEVTFGWTGEDVTGADEHVRRAVHRIVREALTNIHKHAPGAQATVRAIRTPERVIVEVTNGTDPVAAAVARFPSGGAGLTGLHERVRLLGGVFRAEPTGDGGFTVVAEIPLNAGARQPATGEPFAQPAPTPRGSLPTARARAGFPRPAFIVVAAVLVGLFTIVGLGAVVSGLTAGVMASNHDTGTPRIGMSLQDFLDNHSANDPYAQLAVRGQEPAPPAGAICLYQRGTVFTKNPLGFVGSSGDEVRVHRYCFADDKLVDIQDLDLTGRAR